MAIEIKEYVGYNIKEEVSNMAYAKKKATTKKAPAKKSCKKKK